MIIKTFVAKELFEFHEAWSWPSKKIIKQNSVWTKWKIVDTTAHPLCFIKLPHLTWSGGRQYHNLAQSLATISSSLIFSLAIQKVSRNPLLSTQPDRQASRMCRLIKSLKFSIETVQLWWASIGLWLVINKMRLLDNGFIQRAPINIDLCVPDWLPDDCGLLWHVWRLMLERYGRMWDNEELTPINRIPHTTHFVNVIDRSNYLEETKTWNHIYTLMLIAVSSGREMERERDREGGGVNVQPLYTELMRQGWLSYRCIQYRHAWIFMFL